jgi:hypothetical protein
MGSVFNKFVAEDSIESFSRFASRAVLIDRYGHVPGDIVECGVLQGSGMLTFLRLLKINGIKGKHVVGFDWFNTPAMLKALPPKDRAAMQTLFKKPTAEGMREKLYRQFGKLGFNNFDIIDGDIAATAPRYAREKPQISILYMDVDCDGPTYAGLSALYDYVVPGGIIVFDDYGTEKWSEKAGADRFCHERGIELPKPWHVARPRAYIEIPR